MGILLFGRWLRWEEHESLMVRTDAHKPIVDVDHLHQMVVQLEQSQNRSTCRLHQENTMNLENR